MTKDGYDINDNDTQVKLIIYVKGLFNRNIELENIIAPKMDQYEPLIEEYKQLAKDLLVVSMSISKQPKTEFTEVIGGMLEAMIRVVEANINHWTKLKGKAFRTAKYSFSENRRDTKRIAALVKDRQWWGQRMNQLNQQVMEGKS